METQENDDDLAVKPNQTIYINNLNERIKKEGNCKNEEIISCTHNFRYNL